MLHTIVGKRGRGKTSLAAEIIASQRRDRIWIYDYMAEFQGFAIKDFIEVLVPGQISFEEFSNRVWSETPEPTTDPKTGLVTPPKFSTLVVLDEVSSYGRIGANDHPCLGHFYRLGRHKSIDLVSISQRFYSLPPIVRSQTDVFHVFQITEPRDTQYLNRLVSPSTLQTILRLEKFQYINISL